MVRRWADWLAQVIQSAREGITFDRDTAGLLVMAFLWLLFLGALGVAHWRERASKDRASKDRSCKDLAP